MKGLTCTTSTCEYNRGCHCNAGVINIGKNGVCTTKVKREYGALGQLFENRRDGFEAAEDFDYGKNEELLIQCDSVKCIYNKDALCRSGVVNVGNGFLKTKCFTKKTID
jgi:hypothetical protein